jgi:hypothetical protein
VKIGGDRGQRRVCDRGIERRQRDGQHDGNHREAVSGRHRRIDATRGWVINVGQDALPVRTKDVDSIVRRAARKAWRRLIPAGNTGAVTCGFPLELGIGNG